MLEDDPYRVLGGVPFFEDLSFNLINNRRIFQNESIDIEDGVLVFRDQMTHTGFDHVNLLNAPLHRAAKSFRLPLRTSGFFLWNRAQIHAWLQDKSSASTKTGRCCETGQTSAPVLFEFRYFFPTTPFVGSQLAHGVVHALLKVFAFLFLVFERFSKTGLNNDACCLCRDCRQQADFVAGEFTPAGSMDDENAECFFFNDTANTEK